MINKRFTVKLSTWTFIVSFFLLNWISGEAMALTLQSSAFTDGDSIPSQYTCDARNISPPLHWQGEPEHTKSFTLIVDDPDAPHGVWDHWIIFNIPATTHALSENLHLLPSGAQYGKNSWGNAAYGGPCPPDGEHRYVFKLYALDVLLSVPAGSTKAQIESEMKGHVLARAELMGLYKR